MLVRGNANDLQINRNGQLSAGQTAALRRFTPFRLPVVPSVLVGALLLSYGVVRRDTLGWIVVALGLVLLTSGWARRRGQAALKAGVVQSFAGVLEQTRPSPLGMFEAELTIDGRSYVLLANLGSRPLQVGTRYQVFVARGLARLGIIVAMEEL